MPQTIKTLYIKSTTISGIAKICLALSGVIVVWQLNHVLDKNTFGAFMIVFSLYQIIATTVASTFQSLILYHVSSDHSEQEQGHKENPPPHLLARSSLTYGTLISIAISLTLTFSADIISKLFNEPSIHPWLIIMAAFIPCFCANIILTSWQRALQNVKDLTLYNEIYPSILRIAALAALGLPTVLTNYAPEFISAAYCASYLLPFIALYIKAPLAPSLKTQCFTRWDISYAIKTALSQLINKSTRNIVIVMSGALTNTSITADLAIATRFGQLLLIPKNALVQLLTPRLRAHLKNSNHNALITEFRATQSLMTIATLLGLIGYILFAKPVLGLFGEYGETAYAMLIILSLTSLVRAAFGDAGGYVASAGHAGLILTTQILSLLVLYASFIALLPPLGGVGIAYANVITVIFSMSCLALIAKRYNKHCLIEWPEALTITLSCASIAGLIHFETSAIITTATIALLTLTYGAIRAQSIKKVF